MEPGRPPRPRGDEFLELPHTKEAAKKKRHHQLRTVLCGRCRLREKLSHLCNEKALIVKLVDIVDFNGSFLVRTHHLAGPNTIILVVTKVIFFRRELILIVLMIGL